MTSRALPLTVLPALALTGVAAVWGSTFFLIKDLINDVTPLDFLGVRFAIVAIVVLAVWGKRLRHAGALVWRRGAVLGVVYGAAQLAQTIGLAHTPASVSGFITGLYVVFTPVLLYLAYRHRVSASTWGAVALATAGLMVLSLTGLSFGFGESITLLGSALYAVHIVLLGRWSRQSKPFSLALVQGVALGVVCLAAALPGGVSAPATAAGWTSLLYMAFVAGLGALVVQTWAQSRISPTTTAVVMTSEPVFAASFAIAFGGEHLTVRLVVGGGLVLAAMVAAELTPVRGTPAPALHTAPTVKGDL